MNQQIICIIGRVSLCCKHRGPIVDSGTDQAEGDAHQLEYVGVGDAVHAANNSVSSSERGTH